MIKCEVVFEGDVIVCGDYWVDQEKYSLFNVGRKNIIECSFNTLEKAITYCMEQSNDQRRN